MKKFTFLLLLLIGVAAFSQVPNPISFGISSDAVPVGLKKGQKAPDFTLKTAEGKNFNLYTKLKSNPVVLIFYRGYWCPVCNRYLSAYQDSLHLITQKGVDFIAVTPETYENVEKTREKTNADFKILSDPDGKIMIAYQLNFKVTTDYQKMIETKLHASIAKTNGQDEASLPVPATFIINKYGTIVYQQFDLDYHKRASVAEILRNLP